MPVFFLTRRILTPSPPLPLIAKGLPMGGGGCGREAELFFFKFLFGVFFCLGLYSARVHLPPLRFHCADGCWDRTQDRCNYVHWLSDTLTTRLDLSRIIRLQESLAFYKSFNPILDKVYSPVR